MIKFIQVRFLILAFLVFTTPVHAHTLGAGDALFWDGILIYISEMDYLFAMFHGHTHGTELSLGGIGMGLIVVGILVALVSSIRADVFLNILEKIKKKKCISIFLY